VLYASTTFSRFVVLVFRTKRLGTNTCQYFLVYFEKPCFQNPGLLYKRFIIMLSDVEFNFEQNDVSVKLNSANISVVSNKKITMI
jgi:hypothetical protein